AFGDLFVDRARYDHEVGLPGARSEDHAEAVKVVARCAGRHHFDGTTGDPEEQIPQGRLATPVDNPSQVGGHYAGEHFTIHQTHRRTPFFQAYRRPSSNIKRKMNMRTKPYIPKSRRTTAHGKR